MGVKVVEQMRKLLRTVINLLLTGGKENGTGKRSGEYCADKRGSGVD